MAPASARVATIVPLCGVVSQQVEAEGGDGSLIRTSVGQCPKEQQEFSVPIKYCFAPAAYSPPLVRQGCVFVWLCGCVVVWLCGCVCMSCPVPCPYLRVRARVFAVAALCL